MQKKERGGAGHSKKTIKQKELKGAATPLQTFIFSKNPPSSSATKARTCVGNE